MHHKKVSRTARDGSQVTGKNPHQEPRSAFNRPTFVQAVIRWTLTELKKEQQLRDLSELEPRCSGPLEYLSRYIPLILQDARGVIASGLDKAKQDINKPFHLRLSLSVREPNSKDPWIFKFQGSIKSKDNDSGFTMNVLRLRKANLAFIGIASEDKKKHHVTVLCNVMYGFREERQFFNEGVHWEATYLCSLVTHKRMFDACHSTVFNYETKVLLNKIARGDIITQANASSNPPLHYPHLIMESQRDVNVQHESDIKGGHRLDSISNLQAANDDDSLNSSQWSAVNSFIALLVGNIMLLQGPPGTGKTTTVTYLLKICCDLKQRTLVSAPSNKAIQVLAIRFLQMNPTVMMVVTGVETKMNPELRCVFLSYLVKTIAELTKELSRLHDATLKEKQSLVQFVKQQQKD
jgi:hypothetical protein